MGAGTCRRGLGAARRAEGEGAHALPEIGSEVLGTERGTRPDTGLLSTARSSSGKGEAGGGWEPERGGVAEASIFGSAWPLGGVRPATSAQSRRAAGLGLGPARFSSVRFGLRRPDENATRLRPFKKELMVGLMVGPISFSSQSELGGGGAKERSGPTQVQAELDLDIGGSSTSAPRWRCGSGSSSGGFARWAPKAQMPVICTNRENMCGMGTHTKFLKSVILASI